MLNDRDDKHEGHEESEYHFSDEEVSYDVETESPRPVSASGKESLIGRLTQSKRMLISLVVFLVLVFVVYKMVAPVSSTAVITDIAPPMTTAGQQAMPASTPSVVAQQQQVPPSQAIPPTEAVTVSVPVDQGPSVIPVAAPTAQQANTPPTVAGSASPVTTMPTAEPASQMMQQPPAPSSGQVEAMSQQTMPQQAPAQSVAASPSPPPSLPPQVVAQMPPEQAYSPSTVDTAPVAPPQSLPETNPILEAMTPSQLTSPVQAQVSNLTTENNRLIAQMQANSEQRMNEFTTQTKAVQSQVQALNSRVTNMETQLNQLVQILTRQAQNQRTDDVAPAQTPSSAAPRINYSVQAIIPGRAWLRSENGETVTVAEGDTIKDVGKVTKIDPYDGVVEINVGNKTVSLSYGNGG